MNFFESERARTLDEWHEDDGPALWWRFPVDEPPYSGSPLDDQWPGYHTHWTPIRVPADPTAAPAAPASGAPFGGCGACGGTGMIDDDPALPCDCTAAPASASPKAHTFQPYSHPGDEKWCRVCDMPADHAEHRASVQRSEFLCSECRAPLGIMAEPGMVGTCSRCVKRPTVTTPEGSKP